MDISDDDANDDYLPDASVEQESSGDEDSEKQKTENDFAEYQKKSAKQAVIRDRVSSCKPMKVDVSRIGNDFLIIPADSRINRDGKIDFTWKQYMLKPSFAAIVGVARTGDPSEELLAARPLAWSYPRSEEEMDAQYDAVTDAYMQVFGFSEEDVHCNKLFVTAHFGVWGKVPSKYRDPKREIGKRLYQKFKRMDGAALKAELEQREEKHPAYERKEKRPTLSLPNETCKLEFDPELETKDFEGLMVIAWHINPIRPRESSYGKTIGKVLNFDNDMVHNKHHINTTMWGQPFKVSRLIMLSVIQLY